MKIKLLSLLIASFILTACSATDKGRAQCASDLDTAWHELDIAKTEGFAGSISYTKALTLLTTAKTEQQVESYDRCINNAQKANYYIKESRAGR